MARGLLWDRWLGARLKVVELEDEVLQLIMSTRWVRQLGMVATAYLAGDLLVDTGFAHVGDLVAVTLECRDIAAIACTHHHEDHTGNAGTIATAHRCPVYVRDAGRVLDEGLRRLPAYRRFHWGSPAEYSATEMPEVVRSEGRQLLAVPTPGHSATHTVLFEERTGLVFTGDLFVSSGASAVMSHEDPFEIVRSLRRVAELEPRRMLTGHGLVVERPAQKLLTKAERVEEALTRTLELHREGLSEAAILNEIFGPRDWTERLQVAMTAGEFSRANFVRAVIRRAGRFDAAERAVDDRGIDERGV